MAHGKPFHSLNPTLNALRIGNLEDEFITVSPITGVGDYTTIYDALQSGAPNIFVKAGTYLETNDLVLSGQNLHGESAKTTIIQLIDHSIIFETHDATNAYDFGTAQLVNNNTQVNGGGGTLWDTGPNAPSGFTDPWLIIRGMAFPIENFVNDTTLNLRDQYRGDTQVGNYYIIDAINIGSRFSDFKVEHTPTVGTPCMLVSGIGVVVERNIFQCNRLNTTFVVQTGVDTNSVAALVKIQENVIISGSIGIELKNAQSCTVSKNQLEDQNDHAIRTNTDDHDCYGNQITENKIYGSTNTAIELDASSHFTNIEGNELEYCRNAAITMDGCNWCRIENNKWDAEGTSITFTNNCSWGTISNNVSADGDWELSCVTFTINGNTVECGSIHVTGNENTVNSNVIGQGQIYSTGNHSTVNGNMFTWGIADWAIRLNGARNSPVGNVIKDVEGSGIGLDGTGGHNCSGNVINSAPANGIDVLAPDCVVENNVIYDIGDYGIETDQTADRCIIRGNRIYSNTGDTGIRLAVTEGIIQGNLINNMGGGYGIHVRHLGALDGDELLIQNNKIKTAAIGIFVDSNNGMVKIDGNHIHTTTTLGIQIDSTGATNFTINDNTIIDAGTIAILLDAGGRYSTINDNVISNPGSHGIHLNTGLTDLHCTINGNNIEGAGGSGIFLDREGQAAGDRNDHCVVNGNNVRDSVGDGILCESLRCIISNNRCDDGSADGICVRNGDQSIVSNNGCDNNTTHGIDIENTADRIIITGNICLNNGVAQLINNGTNTVAANNIVV